MTNIILISTEQFYESFLGIQGGSIISVLLSCSDRLIPALKTTNCSCSFGHLFIGFFIRLGVVRKLRHFHNDSLTLELILYPILVILDIKLAPGAVQYSCQ